MRLTNADKRKKVNDYCQDYECMFWTDAKIAIEADVSLPFVTRMRGDNKPEKIIVERNGKTFERKGKNKAKLDNVIEAPIEKDDPRDDVIKHLAEENEKLKDQMIIGAIDDTGEQQTASELIEELRKENQILSNQLNTVKISRDTLMNENAQLKKQVAVLQRKLKSLES
jgi:FtsZ-binding cell division protein ZapB